MSDQNRFLFESGTQLNKMLQIVSGAATVAAISQAGMLVDLAGHLPFLLFVTLTSLSIMLSVVSVYFNNRHVVRSSSSRKLKTEADSFSSNMEFRADTNTFEARRVRKLFDQSKKESTKAHRSLIISRLSLLLSFIVVVLAFFIIIPSFWYSYACPSN